MNKEDITRLAQEAGFVGMDGDHGALRRFAALVASAEREECERGYLRLQSLMEIRETQPNKPCCLAEREACAKVCDYLWEDDYSAYACAEAIRARGDNK